MNHKSPLHAPFALFAAIVLVLVTIGAAASSGLSESGTQGNCHHSECSTEQWDLEVIRSGPSVLAEMDRDGEQALVRGHHWGAVASMSEAGETFWERQSSSLRVEWGMDRELPMPPKILSAPTGEVGWDYNGVAGTVWGTPIAAGDVNGDGVDDVMVAHNYVFAGSILDEHVRAVVTLLDGRDGRTLWWDAVEGQIITGLVFTDGKLIVAQERGPQGRARYAEPVPSYTALRAFSFAASGGVTVEEDWSLQLDEENSRRRSLVTAGGERVAFASLPRGTSDATVVVVDTSSGDVLWSAQRPGRVPLVRYDAFHDEIVITEAAPQEDIPFEEPITGANGAVNLRGNGFSLVSLDAGSGAEKKMVPVQATGGPQQLQIADATGDGIPDRLVTGQVMPNPGVDSGAATGLPSTRSLLTLIDGQTGLPLWQRTTGTSVLPEQTAAAEAFLPPTHAGGTATYGLAATGSTVIAASTSNGFGDNDPIREVQAFDGLTGLPSWSKSGIEAPTPSSLIAGEYDGQAVVRGITRAGTFHAYSVEDGSLATSSALLSEVHAATGAQVTEDGTHGLVVGADSGGVFALKPYPMGREDPFVHWKLDFAGPVRELQLADVDGDGVDEVIVAAQREVGIIDTTTGEAVSRMPYPEGFIWTVTIEDVDDDGLPDVIVPGNSLDAYRGLDGESLWSHGPDTTPDQQVMFSTTRVVEGVVVSQYAVRTRLIDDHLEPLEFRQLGLVGGVPSGPPQRAGVVGLQVQDGEEVWHRPLLLTEAMPALSRSVAPAPDWDGSGIDAVAVIEHPGDATAWAVGPISSDIRILDPQTGADLLDEPFHLPGAIQPGLVNFLPDKLMVKVGAGLKEVTPKGLEPWSPVSGPLGSFGPVGELMVDSIIGYYSTWMLLSLDEDNTPSVVADGETHLRIGSMVATDVDGDGMDEIIGFPGERGFAGRLLNFATGWIRGGYGIDAYGVMIVDVKPAVSPP